MGELPLPFPCGSPPGRAQPRDAPTRHRAVRKHAACAHSSAATLQRIRADARQWRGKGLTAPRTIPGAWRATAPRLGPRCCIEADAIAATARTALVAWDEDRAATPSQRRASSRLTLATPDGWSRPSGRAAPRLGPVSWTPPSSLPLHRARTQARRRRSYPPNGCDSRTSRGILARGGLGRRKTRHGSPRSDKPWR
jgi:hypothetical protein